MPYGLYEELVHNPRTSGQELVESIDYYLHTACRIYSIRSRMYREFREAGHVNVNDPLEYDEFATDILRACAESEYENYHKVEELLRRRAPAPEQEVVIHIKTMTGRTYSVTAVKTDSVMVLRYLLFRDSAIDIASQDLFFQGEILGSYKIIGDFVRNNTATDGSITVHLTMRMPCYGLRR
jgi:hypothetical protein